MSKKKLDELFQDKFLDFKEVPDDKVWASIEASLDKKKKKRILPLWWSLGGIAAALLIGLIVFNPFDKETNMEQIITDVEHHNSDDIETLNERSKELDLDPSNEDTLEVVTEKKSQSILEKSETQIVTTENAEDRSTEDKKNTIQKNSTATGNDWIKEKEAVVQTAETTKKEKGQKYQDINKTNLKSDVTITAKLDVHGEEKTIEGSANDGKTLQDKLENGVANNDSDNKQNPITINDSNVVEKIGLENKKSLAVLSQKEQKADSIRSLNKTSIFDAIDDQKEEAVAKTSTKKWSAGPSVAPVYFNAMGEGSSVHSIFVPNSKSGNINMSYGLSVGYEISPKLRVRSGIHKVDYGYDTNDIAFSSSPIATTNGQIDNINYRTTSRNLVVSSKPGGSAREQAPSNSLDVSSSQNVERDGIMTQQMGYLEIPLELNYALIDKKFGLTVIGGVSSLFLVDNSVALTSGDLTTEMGNANNLNDLNFSANFGLGVNYKFSQNIHLNIEPVFKYQLNTFSETDGTFNPYALGVYSGLSFRF